MTWNSFCCYYFYVLPFVFVSYSLSLFTCKIRYFLACEMARHKMKDSLKQRWRQKINKLTTSKVTARGAEKIELTWQNLQKLHIFNFFPEDQHCPAFQERALKPLSKTCVNELWSKKITLRLSLFNKHKIHLTSYASLSLFLSSKEK